MTVRQCRSCGDVFAWAGELHDCRASLRAQLAAALAERDDARAELALTLSYRAPGSCQCGDDDACRLARERDALRAAGEAMAGAIRTLDATTYALVTTEPETAGYDAAMAAQTAAVDARATALARWREVAGSPGSTARDE